MSLPNSFQNILKEEWKDCPGHKGYQVSNMGRVKSVLRHIMRKNGRSQTIKEKILKPYRQPSSKHYTVCVGSTNVGGRIVEYVHRLVLEAFVSFCPMGLECRHYPDRDPANNKLENLQWGTRVENVADAIEHGTFHVMSTRGEKHGLAKLNWDLVRWMRKQFVKMENRGKYVKISEMLLEKGVQMTPEGVRLVILKKNWREDGR